jgi:hypothetical protein
VHEQWQAQQVASVLGWGEGESHLICALLTTGVFGELLFHAAHELQKQQGECA